MELVTKPIPFRHNKRGVCYVESCWQRKNIMPENGALDQKTDMGDIDLDWLYVY